MRHMRNCPSARGFPIAVGEIPAVKVSALGAVAQADMPTSNTVERARAEKERVIRGPWTINMVPICRNNVEYLLNGFLGRLNLNTQVH